MNSVQLIQDCLTNSESKLESAKLLGDNTKYEEAIFFAIIAYEEAGKADFLINKIVNKEQIFSNDWDSLTKGGSHTKKLIMYYENRKKTFEMMTDSDFRTLQNHYKKTFPVTQSHNEVIDELQKKIDCFKKLNILKKNITYVDNQQNHPNFTENELNAIYLMLDFETKLSISLTKLGLDINSITPTGNNSEDLKQIDKFDSFKKMIELQKESTESNNIKQFALAKSILKNL